MTGDLVGGEDPETQRDEGLVKKAMQRQERRPRKDRNRHWEMQLQAKECQGCQKPPEAARDQEGFFPVALLTP